MRSPWASGLVRRRRASRPWQDRPRWNLPLWSCGADVELLQRVSTEDGHPLLGTAVLTLPGALFRSPQTSSLFDRGETPTPTGAIHSEGTPDPTVHTLDSMPLWSPSQVSPGRRVCRRFYRSASRLDRMAEQRTPRHDLLGMDPSHTQFPVGIACSGADTIWNRVRRCRRPTRQTVRYLILAPRRSRTPVT